MNPDTQLELITYDAETGEYEPRFLQEATLFRCSREIQKLTAFTPATSEKCVVSIVAAALTGCPLTIAGHVTWCAGLYILTGYSSTVRLLLDFAAQIFWTIQEVGSSGRSSTVEDLWPQPVEPHDRVVVGTEGPFRAFGPKSLPVVNQVASAIRGHHGEQCPHLTALLAAEPNDLILVAAAGRSLGFASMITTIQIESTAGTLPVALKHIGELELFHLIVALRLSLAKRGSLHFKCSKKAESMMIEAVQGMPFWADGLRKIGSLAAALHVLAGPQVPAVIDAVTATRAIKMWRENEATMEALSGIVPARAAATAAADDLAVKALRLLDYCVREDVREMSLRDALLHRFAKSAPEAMLQLAWLETKGLARQVVFVKRGCARQKWLLNSQQSSAAPAEGNTEKSAENQPSALLTFPGVEGAQ